MFRFWPSRGSVTRPRMQQHPPIDILVLSPAAVDGALIDVPAGVTHSRRGGSAPGSRRRVALSAHARRVPCGATDESGTAPLPREGIGLTTEGRV